MPLGEQRTYTKAEATARPYPNHWDLLALVVVFSVLGVLVWGAWQMHSPYAIGEPIPISLSPSKLPYYALRTVLRMFIALFISLIATFIFGTWAAKSRYAERVIIPMVDVLQSVPILSFLTLTIVAFIALFPGSLLGPECCAIFAIFTSQAWNMILSFYQSLKTIPKDLKELTLSFRLSAWQRFWRLEVPFAMPGLLWNMMLSMSASWFFVVASEAIIVDQQTITLPGIGSYIAMAITHRNMHAIVYALLTMIVVILLYDQLLFRPLNAWIDQFKANRDGDERGARSWVVDIFRRARWVNGIGAWWRVIGDVLVNRPRPMAASSWVRVPKVSRSVSRWGEKLWLVFEWLFIVGLTVLLGIMAHQHFSWLQIGHVVYLGLITGFRVMVLIMLASVVWLPVGVWVGMQPQMRSIIAPIVQFLAAFPANLLFPVAFVLIVRYHLDPNIWCAPLMVLGTQWYILFNVVAGASDIPKDLKYVAENFGVRGWLRWQRFLFPAIFPYFLTGAITAAGGAWNASVVAEVIPWGKQVIQVVGLGNYIAMESAAGNYSNLLLGTVIMSVYVLLINRFFWRPLYRLAETRQ